MSKSKDKNRTQYTAELIPIVVYKGEIVVGEGYILIREDGMETKPILHDNEGNLLPSGPYMLHPHWEMKYLVVVPESKQ